MQQVKSKFGRLAHYANSDKFMSFDNPFYGAKNRAEERSVTIGELCGEPGQMCEAGPVGTPGRWVKTLYQAHAAAGYRGRAYAPVEAGYA